MLESISIQHEYFGIFNGLDILEKMNVTDHQNGSEKAHKSPNGQNWKGRVPTTKYRFSFTGCGVERAQKPTTTYTRLYPQCTWDEGSQHEYEGQRIP